MEVQVHSRNTRSFVKTLFSHDTCADSIPGSGACAWKQEACIPDGKYFMKLGALGDSNHFVSELHACYYDTKYDGTCGMYCTPQINSPHRLLKLYPKHFA